MFETPNEERAQIAHVQSESAAQDRDTLRIALDAWGAGGTMREKIERLWDEREAEIEQLRKRVDAAHAEGLMDAAEAMTPRG